MKIYFVRHAESVANILRVFSNLGWKHPLTEKGVQQARDLAEKLASHHIHTIYSSPVMRAVQTAEILASALHLEIEITEALREWSVGILEDTSAQEGWDLQRKVLDDWFVHHRLESKIPGGENFFEIRARFEPFVERLTREETNQEKNIVLLGHGGLYTVMLPVIFKNLPRGDFANQPFPNTAYALGETRPDGLYCTEWCGVPVQGSSLLRG